MNEANSRIVRGQDGWQGTLEQSLDNRQSPLTHVAVQLDNGRRVTVPSTALVRQLDGSYYLDLAVDDLYQVDGNVSADSLVIPVVEEELDVQTRQVERGRIRFTKTVHEREEVVQMPLTHDEVQVERIAVNRPISEPPPVRYEGDTMIVPVVEEVMVIEKRLMLKEELRISKRQVQEQLTETVVLRSEEVVVEPLGQGVAESIT
jgi:uncharacterized protein (TIGR02271 family)